MSLFLASLAFAALILYGNVLLGRDIARRLGDEPPFSYGRVLAWNLWWGWTSLAFLGFVVGMGLYPLHPRIVAAYALTLCLAELARRAGAKGAAPDSA